MEPKATVSDKMGSLPKINSKEIANMNNKEEKKY